MKFKNMTNKKEIDLAITIAEKLLSHGSKLAETVECKDDWKYDNIQNGSQVVYNLFNVQRKAIPVYTYKPKIPWSKAIGYFDGKAIHVNIKKLPFMTIVEIAENLTHEYAHYCGYSHGNNYKTKEKCLYSVPYFLSENVARWL